MEVAIPQSTRSSVSHRLARRRYTTITPLRLSAHYQVADSPILLATRASGPHPFPSRTRSLSLTAPMVLRSRDRGRVGRRRHPCPNPPSRACASTGDLAFLLTPCSTLSRTSRTSPYDSRWYRHRRWIPQRRQVHAAQSPGG